MTRVRVNADNLPAAPGLNCDPDFGQLLITSDGSAFASASNPTAADVKGTGVVAGASYGVTLDATNGLLTVKRPGTYEVGFAMGQISSASASGVITLELQKNAASLSKKCISKILEPAVGNNFMAMGNSQIVTGVAAGDVFKLVITGTVGGVITITEGSITVKQLADATVTHE